MALVIGQRRVNQKPDTLQQRRRLDQHFDRLASRIG
jgi:hypothetical protein